MEDPNMFAADCIVLSCCCQCLILQILVFVLFKFPSKLLKKLREYAKKFRARNKKPEIVEIAMEGYEAGKSSRIDIDDFYLVESVRFGCCMEEIEGVLEEFSSRGEFDFGSFWGGGVCESRRSFGSCCKKEVANYGDVGYRLMELFGEVKLYYE